MSQDEHTTSNVSAFQKIIAILGGIIAPIFVVYTLTKSPEMAVDVPVVTIDVASNIKPLAVVEMAPDRSAYVEMSGEDVVNQSCAMCHGTGALNSPKIGDNTAWEARIAQGYEMLTKNAIDGIRTMPARGGNADLTNNEVAKAVAYMANKSGASFAAPTE